MISSSENVFQVRKRKLYLPFSVCFTGFRQGWGGLLTHLVQPHLTCVVLLGVSFMYQHVWLVF